MKNVTVTNDDFSHGGFTSGMRGIWTRNEPLDPPTNDYVTLSDMLGVPLSQIIRPYQASGDKVRIVDSSYGGSGVIKDNELKKVDGLITAENNLVLSIIAADCVPVYLIEKKAGIIGLLHCGWRSASGFIIRNAVECMRKLGASPDRIQIIIGPHICPDCYEVGEDVKNTYAEFFSHNELDKLFTLHDKKLHLNLLQTIRIKSVSEGIPVQNITDVNECTFHNTSFYSYRRGDRGKQNLAFLMMK